MTGIERLLYMSELINPVYRHSTQSILSAALVTLLIDGVHASSDSSTVKDT
jgi:hypothetical protein